MKKLNTKGFTLVEGFIAVFVIVLVVGLGFYAKNRMDDKASKAESAETVNAQDVVPLEKPKDLASGGQITSFTRKLNSQLDKEKNGQAVREGSNCNNGQGTSGHRVQMVYVTKATNDTFNQDLPTLRSIAAGVDITFMNSAAKTGGKRQVKWVRNNQCKIEVKKIIINNSTFYENLRQFYANDVNAMIKKLKDNGVNSSDTKYMVYVNNKNGAWGPWLLSRRDNSKGASNKNNMTSYQFIGRPLWEQNDLPSQRVSSMLLMSALGAQQPTAPHAYKYFDGSYYGRFSDNEDILGFQGGPGVPAVTYPCPQDPNDYGNGGSYYLFDCNNDDYFNTNPKPGSYLSKNWNTANSPYLFTPAN